MAANFAPLDVVPSLGYRMEGWMFAGNCREGPCRVRLLIEEGKQANSHVLTLQLLISGSMIKIPNKTQILPAQI